MDVSGTFVTKEEYETYMKERDDLETPHNCTAELESPDVGAPLEELDAHAEEFHKMVEDMFEKLPTETRLLEGVEIPSYDEVRERLENELSKTNETIDNGQCAGSMDS
jgi:hypothetical protein